MFGWEVSHYKTPILIHGGSWVKLVKNSHHSENSQEGILRERRESLHYTKHL